jgi:beta-lactamase class A
MRGVTAAFNDIGIMTLPDGRSVIIAAFLTAAKTSREERTELFGELTRQVASHLR